MEISRSSLWYTQCETHCDIWPQISSFIVNQFYFGSKVIENKMKPWNGNQNTH